MAIAEQFAGLDMGKLIGGPLTATADASIMLANSTAEFINKVGFDDAGKVRTVAFSYEKHTPNEDGTSSLDAMKVDVPMLAIVPIPNLQVDEVNILFDMEVKQSESSKSSTDVGVGFSGSANLGIIKINISGSVSSHKENTRSSDNSAKYHVDVRATNHGTPEGLARGLDMMAANVAPALVGSTIKSADGTDLPEKARIRAEKLKKLRAEISAIETRRNAALSGLQESITQFRNVADTQMSVYSARMAALSDEDKSDGIADTRFGQVAETWNGLKNQAERTIKMIADTQTSEEENPAGVSGLFGLKAFKGKADVVDYGAEEEKYEALSAAQKAAVNAQKNLAAVDQELSAKKTEYNNLMSGLEPDRETKASEAAK